MPSKTIFCVSGGKGLAAHTMVQSLIIQYQDNRLKVKVFPNVQSEDKIKEVVQKVKREDGVLTHTMVNTDLRNILIKECADFNVPQIDFMGGLAGYIENVLGLKSAKTPGLYRRINAQYFERIDAIEYTLNQDDGINPKKITGAEIILTGVSRSGKTPLSVYMSMFGWKVANVPLIKDIPPPEELFIVDPKRVFGLQINMNHLISQRTKRLEGMGNQSNVDYVDKRIVARELQYANLIFARGGFTKINVTNKAIESTANEIIGMISDRFGYQDRKFKRKNMADEK